ncbi:uncharacterized protein LOC127716262 [Mytilus californianus]|uniref:uncharacterized protein LOC127716262 n=1 Tax=Mytilus californianus TaxID=6549 RepID=UPI0022464980|nr:uncharacterized protein LOC127716262 [Mytilus californianus]
MNVLIPEIKTKKKNVDLFRQSMFGLNTPISECRRRNKLDDFDGIRSILSQSNIEDNWMPYVQEDGGLFYVIIKDTSGHPGFHGTNRCYFHSDVQRNTRRSLCDSSSQKNNHSNSTSCLKHVPNNNRSKASGCLKHTSDHRQRHHTCSKNNVSSSHNYCECLCESQKCLPLKEISEECDSCTIAKELCERDVNHNFFHGNEHCSLSNNESSSDTQSDSDKSSLSSSPTSIDNFTKKSKKPFSQRLNLTRFRLRFRSVK